MWTLLLTLIVPYGADAPHVFVVDGFATRERCVAAGDAWLAANTMRYEDGASRNFVRAVCVQK